MASDGGEAAPAKADEDPNEDPTTRKLRVALEALRARRTELREANTELDSLRETLLKAQADAETEREAKEFVRAERDLLEKAKDAYARDTAALKVQLDTSRESLEEERAAIKKLQMEVAEERKARLSLKSEIERLQSQLGSLGDGLKKLSTRLNTSNSELEETKKAKEALACEAESLKSRLTENIAELDVQRGLAVSLKEQLEEQKKAGASAIEALPALQEQLQDAREALGRDQAARLLGLGEARTELEAALQGAWHDVWQELDQAPHRMLCTRSSAIKPRKLRPTAASGPTMPAGSGNHVAFAAGEALTATVSVTSFRDMGPALWFPQPESSVQCSRCENRSPQTLGRMKKVPGVSQFMLEEFLCLECARHDAVDNKRNDAMASFLQPMSSPTHQVEASSSSSSEESYSSPPRSDCSGDAPGGASMGLAALAEVARSRSSDELQLRKKQAGGEGYRRTRSADDIGRLEKKRKT